MTAMLMIEMFVIAAPMMAVLMDRWTLRVTWIEGLHYCPSAWATVLFGPLVHGTVALYGRRDAILGDRHGHGLRAASWPCHQNLERRLDISARFADLSSYRAHLAGMWGYIAPLEARLGGMGFGSVLTDYASRRKVPLLSRDLQALGVTPAELPTCNTLPDCEEPAAAFGCLYVFEGASLGGRTLLPLVSARLGLQPARGAAFLASYGDQVTGMWNRFGAALEAWCTSPARRDAAVCAAVATFDRLGAWLCKLPP